MYVELVFCASEMKSAVMLKKSYLDFPVSM
jgi:hypothetical protein